jgi:hypothetical protein
MGWEEPMAETPEETNGADEPLRDFEQALASLPNGELLTALDLALLELEKRLLRYARTGHELIEMADEGLVLAVRASARLGQAQSSAAHTASHLQIVGVGDWNPTSTQPDWSDDPRAASEGEELV